MHVLFVPSWYATPDSPVRGSFFRDQAHVLARAGHRIGVIAPNLHSVRRLPAGLAGAAKGIEFEDDAGVATYRLQGAQLLPGLRQTNDRAWISAGRRLFARYVAEQGAPDLIHAHAVFMGGIIGADLGRSHDLPLVITEHSTVYQRRPIPAFQLAEAREALRTASARLVVSPQLGETMEAVLGADAAGWEWVPNVVDRAFLEAPLRASKGDGPYRFLNVAFLHEKKGHADLLTAFAQQFHGDPAVELRIGGDGDERDRLRSLAETLDISHQVVWLGPLGRDEVLAEMLAADAFVLPSRIETFGVVVIEALACGLPVIATRSGGPECIVVNGDGVLVDVGDIRALGDAMAAMRGSGTTVDRAAIRQRCEERFSEHVLVEHLERVYARVTDGAA